MTYRHGMLSGWASAILFLSVGASAQSPAETVQAPAAAVPPAPTTTEPSLAPQAQPEATASPVTPAAVMPTRLVKPRLGWDVNVEGGFGRYFPAHDAFGFGRVRGGLLYSADPMFFALGATYEWSNLEPATFGVQAEAMHIETGLWAQVGGLVDLQVHPGAMFALGWSVLGVELQYRKFDPSDWGFAAVGKIRIPVTFIAKAFK